MVAVLYALALTLVDPHPSCAALHSGFGSQWDVFGDQIQTLAGRMPWMTVEGNHERDYPDSKDRYRNVYDSGKSSPDHPCSHGFAFALRAMRPFAHQHVCRHVRRLAQNLMLSWQAASAASRMRSGSRCRYQRRAPSTTASTSGRSTSCSTRQKCPLTKAPSSTGAQHDTSSGQHTQACTSNAPETAPLTSSLMPWSETKLMMRWS